MAQREELQIHILPNGEVKVDIKNVKGKGCVKYIRLFEEILGKVKEKELKPEYYEPEPKTKIDIQNKELY
ncbi:MAG: DUF2997 domain-containing protein [Candidatus Omnitrophota bacterium]